MGDYFKFLRIFHVMEVDAVSMIREGCEMNGMKKGCTRNI